MEPMGRRVCLARTGILDLGGRRGVQAGWALMAWTECLGRRDTLALQGHRVHQVLMPQIMYHIYPENLINTPDPLSHFLSLSPSLSIYIYIYIVPDEFIAFLPPQDQTGKWVPLGHRDGGV